MQINTGFVDELKTVFEKACKPFLFQRITAKSNARLAKALQRSIPIPRATVTYDKRKNTKARQNRGESWFKLRIPVRKFTIKIGPK